MSLTALLVIVAAALTVALLVVWYWRRPGISDRMLRRLIRERDEERKR
jgi:hypothetical protein